MFNLKKDFNENGVHLKAGKYSREELVKLYGSEGTFDFCLTCTSLKDALEEIAEDKKTFKEKLIQKAEEVLDIVSEDKPISIKFLVEKDIKKGRKTIFKSGAKLNVEELEGFDAQSLVEDGSLIEIKVSE